MPHMSQGRVKKLGQKVHVSACFMDQESYEPKATFDPMLANEVSWAKIIGIGNTDSTSWVEGVEEFVEMDFFDITWVPDLIRKGTSEPENHDLGQFLVFLASTRTSATFLLIHKIICLTLWQVRERGQSCTRN